MSRAGSRAVALVVAGRFGTLWRGGAESGLSGDVARGSPAARVPRLSGVATVTPEKWEERIAKGGRAAYLRYGHLDSATLRKWAKRGRISPYVALYLIARRGGK